MRIRQLEAFRATVITGTISAAAQSMKTSQPTVSRLLIQLEQELQVALFSREKGRLHLTHEGRLFYRRVDQVFTAFSSLSAAAKDLREAAFREVRIFSTPSLAMTIVPDVVARLVKRHPEIQAKLVALDNVSYFNANCETEYDIVLGQKLGFEAHMEQITLAEVDFVCVLPIGHRLAGQDVIHVEDLRDETVISLLDDVHRIFIRHESLFQEAGVPVRQRMFCHLSSTAYAMVSRGLGVALMEPFSAPIWQSAGIVTRPFRPRLTYEFIAGLKPGALQSSAMSEIIAIAREEFQRFVQ